MHAPCACAWEHRKPKEPKGTLSLMIGLKRGVDNRGTLLGAFCIRESASPIIGSYQMLETWENPGGACWESRGMQETKTTGSSCHKGV